MAEHREHDDGDEATDGKPLVRVSSAGISAATYEKLQRVAKRESRSVSSYVARLIERDMKRQRA